MSQVNLNKQLDILKENQVIKQDQLQQQRQTTLLKQMQLQRTGLGSATFNPFRTVRTPPTRIIRIPKIKLEGEKSNKLKNIFGYRTFVKVGGKKKYIGGLFEKGKALRVGEEYAKQTLRATFGVEKTAQTIKGYETRYNPSNIFRGYKIEKGKKVKLEDTYIQKRGKRLISAGEVAEIQQARRNK